MSDDLQAPPTELEVAALLEASRDGLTSAGLLILRRLAFDRDRLAADNRRLRAAVHRHYDQHADDLCVFDDNELYAAFGLGPRVPTVGDPAAMLANCQRFIAQRCQPGGGWKSYAELEAELGDLREARRVMTARLWFPRFCGSSGGKQRWVAFSWHGVCDLRDTTAVWVEVPPDRRPPLVFEDPVECLVATEKWYREAVEHRPQE
jgi:hypothetical protein